MTKKIKDGLAILFAIGAGLGMGYYGLYTTNQAHKASRINAKIENVNATDSIPDLIIETAAGRKTILFGDSSENYKSIEQIIHEKELNDKDKIDSLKKVYGSSNNKYD